MAEKFTVKNKKDPKSHNPIATKIRYKRRGKNKMTDLDLKGVLRGAYSVGISHNATGEITERRTKALRYYRGEPFGNERKGRSSYVSNDVLDTIEAIMPELMEIFIGGDDVVEIEATKQGGEKDAELMTAYCNYVINRDNNGFKLLYTLIKDGLLQNNGIGKVTWEQSEDKKLVRLRELSIMEIIELSKQDDVEVEEQAAYRVHVDEATGEKQEVYLDDEDLEAMSEEELIDAVLWDVKLCYYHENGRNALFAVPPEEFGIAPRSTGLEDNPKFCYHEKETPASELVITYPDRKGEIDQLGGWSTQEYGTEKTNRFSNESFTGSDILIDESMRDIRVVEWYIFIDADGDGIAELRRIVTAGEQCELILENDEVTDNPFFDFSPILEPHRFHGRSLAELVMDIQEIKSTIGRQILDNMYSANNQRIWAIDSQVNMDDLLDSRPNAITRVKSANAIGAFPSGALSGEGLNMMEKLDVTMERRTGAYRQSRGLDMDKLHDTAEGLATMVDKLDKRTMLIARVFAECGFTRMCKLILQNSMLYMDKERSIKIAGEWTDVDPRTWDLDMNFKINVGLGTGNRAETVNRAKELLMSLREFGNQMQGMVTPKQAYNAFEDYLKATGNKEIQRYVTDPETPEYQPPQPQPSEKVQIEQMKAETDKYKVDKELEFDHKKFTAELGLANKKLSIEVMQKINLADQKMGGSVAS